MGTAGEGGGGCVAAPLNGPPSTPLSSTQLLIFPRVSLDQGREAPLQPAPVPDPWSTFQAFGGSRPPKACRALANFSPGHAGRRAGLWRHRSVCSLTLSSWRAWRAGGVRPPCGLPAPGPPAAFPSHSVGGWMGGWSDAEPCSPSLHLKEAPSWVTPLAFTNRVHMCPNTHTRELRGGCNVDNG